MNEFEAYQNTAVMTQSRGHLIVMLYDGAIKFLKLAIREMEAKNFEGRENTSPGLRTSYLNSMPFWTWNPAAKLRQTCASSICI